LAELEKNYPDAEITMVPSSGGRFEVSCDGELLFSKQELGRFPEPGEVIELVSKR
jgi:selenoprotein W-related protein